jgi:dTDP-glucose 4,6-dehydratase
MGLARKLCDIMDQLLPGGRPHASLITQVEDRKGHDFRYAIDSRKLQRELHWSPSYDFEQALRETVAFYSERMSVCGQVVDV